MELSDYVAFTIIGIFIACGLWCVLVIAIESIIDHRLAQRITPLEAKIEKAIKN